MLLHYTETAANFESFCYDFNTTVKQLEVVANNFLVLEKATDIFSSNSTNNNSMDSKEMKECIITGPNGGVLNNLLITSLQEQLNSSLPRHCTVSLLSELQSNNFDINGGE